MALLVDQESEPFPLMDLTSKLLASVQQQSHWSISAAMTLPPESMVCDWESPENWIRFWKDENKLWVHRRLPLVFVSTSLPGTSFWPSYLQIVAIDNFELQCLSATEGALILAFGDAFPHGEFSACRFSAYDLWFHTVT